MKVRRYVYAWFDREQKCVVLSGIKFVDFLPVLGDVDGLVLIKHKYRRAKKSAGLAYVEKQSIPSLVDEDLYGWGDFYWCDYRNPNGPPNISPKEKSKLQNFAARATPVGDVRIGSLANSFLVAGHDDGWYTRVFFAAKASVEQLLQARSSAFDKSAVERFWGGAAFWIQGKFMAQEEATHDVDVVINRRFGLTRKLCL